MRRILDGLKPAASGWLLLSLLALSLSFTMPADSARAADLPSLGGRDAAIVVDGVNGRVLYERDAYELRYPASLTKLMTLYLLFEALHNGSLSLTSELPTSAFAASQSPTKLNLRPGDTIPVETAIKALVVRSANDVAVVVAEALGGTEENFARMMTAKAGQLGMLNTHFANASGLPDREQLTTAADMALLGRHIAYDFPQYFPYVSVTEFTFKGTQYSGHNNLIGSFDGADGLKTGYIRASGFNLATSAVRGNKHVIGVVLGGTTAASRDAEMRRLLTIAFDEAVRNPMLLAYANVPWRAGDGPKTQAVWGPAPTLDVALAAFGPQRYSTAPPPNEITLAAALNTAQLRPADSSAMPASQPLHIAGTDYGALNVAEAYPGADVIGALIENGNAPFEETLTESDPVAHLLPAQKPDLIPASLNVEEGDFGGALGVPETGRLWSVQIGAFADEATANARLDQTASRAGDVLSSAERHIVPLTAEDGRTLYRARFGNFAEAEAYAVCRQMMTRGDTCFAALNEDGT
jgi:D-alanyl-D-alanine carboxypeptidase